jgi:hypothetical protein
VSSTLKRRDDADTGSLVMAMTPPAATTRETITGRLGIVHTARVFGLRM